MMISVYEFALYALAIYRLAHDISSERGAFNLFERLRLWVGRTFPPTHEQTNFGSYERQSWQEQGVNCPICVSFWLGCVTGLALALGANTWLIWVALIFALSTPTVIGKKILG